MDRKESVLYRTGQAWKFWLLPLLVSIGILVLLTGELIKGSWPKQWFLAALDAAVCLEIFAFAFPAIAIRCPSCGARWFWIAMFKQRSDNWFNWLFQPKCPICGYTKNSAN